MSTPFPLEEQAQTDSFRPTWDPSQGPKSSGWFTGMFSDDTAGLGPIYRTLEAMGSGVAKGEAALGGMLHEGTDVDVMNKGRFGLGPEDIKRSAENVASVNSASEAITADARERVAAMTPNPATTGAAVQLLHGLVSGGTEMVLGGLAGGVPGAAAMVGGAEGRQRFEELTKAGVDEGTAKQAGVLTALTAGAGAVLPAGVGSSLIAKVVTGAAGNTAFGMANRYADHQILERAGYSEMADQQRVLDGTQVLTDLVLGAGFGGLAHLHAEAAPLRSVGAEDPARLAALALKDRKAAPGIPVNPEAANAHQAALEKSIADMLEGRPTDVTDTGVTDSEYLARPQEADPEALEMVREYIEDSNLPDPFEASQLREPEATIELPKRNVKTPDAREDSILQYLAKHERGLDSVEAEAQGIDKASFADRTATVGIKRAFRKGGMTFDEAAEHLSESGYPVKDEAGNYSPNVLLDRISDELRGDPQHSALNTRHELEVAAERQYDDKMTARMQAVAPEFAEYDQPTKDFTLLAERATHYDADATERLLRGSTDDGHVEQELRAIVDRGQLDEYHAHATEEQEGGGAARPTAPGQAPLKAGEEPGDRAAADQTARILEDKPGLTIRDENGHEVNAADALKAANDELATERREATLATQAAVSCYLQRGN